jgi:hypothetical protein
MRYFALKANVNGTVPQKHVMMYWHSNDFIATVPVPKSYENYIVKNQLFMCLPPACFETGFGFVSGFDEG